jgi:hypothetical protein
MFIALILLMIAVATVSTLTMRDILDSCAAGHKEMTRKKTCLVCRSRVKSSQKLWDSLDEEQKAIIRETNQEVITRSINKLY